MAEIEERYVFAVGQQSFELNDNRFSTLIPIATSDGSAISAADRAGIFPNRGRVWWMVRGDRRVTEAPPGCLLIADVENAVAAAGSDPSKDHYQVRQPMVPAVQHLVEIVTPAHPPEVLDELLDGFTVRLDHEPTAFVLVRMGGRLVGPLKVNLGGHSRERERTPEISFLKTPNAQIHSFPEEALVGKPGHFTSTFKIWPTNKMLDSGEGIDVRIEAIGGGALEQARADHDPIEMYGADEVVNMVKVGLATRKEKRAFVEMFRALMEGADLPEGMTGRAREILRRFDHSSATIDDLFATLTSDPGLRPRLDAAMKARVEEEVEARAAQLNAKAAERVEELTRRETELRARLEDLDAGFLSKEREHAAALRKREEIAEREIDRRTKEVEALEAVVREDLTEVGDRMVDGRRDLIRDYLALKPLIDGTGATSGGYAPPGREARPAALPSPPLRANQGAQIEETAFFERFVRHAERRGFVYDRDLLLGFHLCAKQDAPIILGGPAGTGKSSLPRLYAEAIAGEAGEPDFLAVDVNRHGPVRRICWATSTRRSGISCPPPRAPSRFSCGRR